MAQYCSFVEFKHLFVDANIYVQFEAKCLSVEETHCPHIEAKCFSFFESIHAFTKNNLTVETVETSFTRMRSSGN